MQIIRGKQKTALKVVVYGPEGIGKSTFAAQFPNPLFIDTEGGTKHMDTSAARSEIPSTGCPFHHCKKRFIDTFSFVPVIFRIVSSIALFRKMSNAAAG